MLPPYESPYKHLKPPVNNSVSTRALKLRFLYKSVSLKLEVGRDWSKSFDFL